MASKGYPGSYKKGTIIKNLEKANTDNTKVLKVSIPISYNINAFGKNYYFTNYSSYLLYQRFRL